MNSSPLEPHCDLGIETQTLTVASFWTSSSDAPSEARPISCENWANFGSASRGTWPSSSWHVSLVKADLYYWWTGVQIQNMWTCWVCTSEWHWARWSNHQPSNSTARRSEVGGSWGQRRGYSRLRSVERVGAVADILSAVKHSVGQTSQEVSGGQVTCHWSNSEARALWNTGSHTRSEVIDTFSSGICPAVWAVVLHGLQNLWGRVRRPPAGGCYPLCSRSVWWAAAGSSGILCRRESGTVWSTLWTPRPTSSPPPRCTRCEGWAAHWEEEEETDFVTNMSEVKMSRDKHTYNL